MKKLIFYHHHPLFPIKHVFCLENLQKSEKTNLRWYLWCSVQRSIIEYKKLLTLRPKRLQSNVSKEFFFQLNDEFFNICIFSGEAVSFTYFRKPTSEYLLMSSCCSILRLSDFNKSGLHFCSMFHQIFLTYSAWRS